MKNQEDRMIKEASRDEEDRIHWTWNGRDKEFFIRPMVREDCQAVHNLLAACFKNPWSTDSLEEMFRVPGYLCLVAVEEAGLVHGFAGLKSVLDQADITDVAVLESDRGWGLGKEMMRQLLEEAAGRGIKEIFLEVRASNKPALALYRRTGFVPVGLRKSYYTDPAEDGILMQWSLVSHDSSNGMMA